MRLFCCGITSNEKEKINDLISFTKNYFDGYVWCVDSNQDSDETYQLLEDNKKEGKIIRHRWTNSHDFQANEWLMCGIFKEGDWCYISDSSEKPSKLWLDTIKKDIEGFELSGVVAVYASGRPYLFKWSEYCFFFLTPHWSLQGLNGKVITIQEQYKNKYIINKRDLNPAKHYQEHDTKYYIAYGRSNQIDAFYGKFGQEVVAYHEHLRREFRDYLRNVTNQEPSLISLEYLFNLGKKRGFTLYEQGIIEIEFCLSEYYQRVILGMDFMNEIASKRFRWSFKEYLLTGNGFKEGYKGTILQYQDKYLNKV